MSAVAAATTHPDVGALDTETDVSSPDAYAARLYERHNRAIFRVCLRELRGREDADDAVQMTFIYALTSLRRGIVPEFELPWLLTIARNVCSTRRRSGMRRREYEAPQDLDSIQDRLATPDRSDVATTGDFSAALRAIPESQRTALLLREWKGLSYGEIGSALGLSQAATEALLFRARQNVAQRLGAKVGLRSLNGLPLLSFLRNLVQSAAGKAVAVGAGAALTVVAVPSAERGVGHSSARPPAVVQLQAVRTVRARAGALPTRKRPFTHTVRANSRRDVAAQRPDVAAGPSLATPPASLPSISSSTTSGHSTPAPAANSSLPNAGVEPKDVIDDVVTTASDATTALGLPAVSVSIPDVAVPALPLQVPQLPSTPSVHLP